MFWPYKLFSLFLCSSFFFWYSQQHFHTCNIAPLPFFSSSICFQHIKKTMQCLWHMCICCATRISFSSPNQILLKKNPPIPITSPDRWITNTTKHEKNFKHKVAQICGLMMEAEIFLVESQLVRRLLCGIKSDVFLLFWVFPFSSYIRIKNHKRSRKGT